MIVLAIAAQAALVIAVQEAGYIPALGAVSTQGQAVENIPVPEVDYTLARAVECIRALVGECTQAPEVACLPRQGVVYIVGLAARFLPPQAAAHILGHHHRGQAPITARMVLASQGRQTTNGW